MPREPKVKAEKSEEYLVALVPPDEELMPKNGTYISPYLSITYD